MIKSIFLTSSEEEVHGANWSFTPCGFYCRKQRITLWPAHLGLLPSSFLPACHLKLLMFAPSVKNFSTFKSHLWRRQWQPTPVFLPGESQGQRSLVGCRLWGHRVGHDRSDLAAAAKCIWVDRHIFTIEIFQYRGSQIWPHAKVNYRALNILMCYLKMAA